MSHEIRTPMNAIINLVKLSLEDNLSAQQKIYLNEALASSELLLAIIGDILDFSKIEANKISLESIPFNLTELLENVYQMLYVKAKIKGIDLKFHCEDQVLVHLKGDPIRLKQILVNLISNAIKFTEQGGVYLAVSIIEKQAETIYLKFCIKDTGIGISAEQIQTLFQPFEQADISTTRKFGGTGLGLAITKHLTDLMQGKIKVESELNQGSQFCLSIPLEISSEISTPEKIVSEETINFENKHILLVEDNKTNIFVAVSILKSTKAKICIALNGAEALKQLEQNKCDLILMDIQMAVMDGFEATEKIRQIPSSYQNIPIIAMTADATIRDKEKCLEIGMNDFILKPIDKDELFITLAKYLA